ncbi:MAG: hypothetical protein ACI4RA_01630 [Kiritimatiellia bacterium]
MLDEKPAARKWWTNTLHAVRNLFTDAAKRSGVDLGRLRSLGAEDYIKGVAEQMALGRTLNEHTAWGRYAKYAPPGSARATDGGGTRYARRVEDERIERIRRAVDLAVNGKPVASLTGDEFAQNGKNDLIDRVADFFKRVGGVAENPELGSVVLDRDSVKSSIGHGIGRAKAAAFAAVPDVIRNGIVFNRKTNWNDRKYDSYVLAAPISIDGKPYVCEAIIEERPEKERRFYLHEVNLQSQFAETIKTPTGGAGLGEQARPLRSILAKDYLESQADWTRYAKDSEADNAAARREVEREFRPTGAPTKAGGRLTAENIPSASELDTLFGKDGVRYSIGRKRRDEMSRLLAKRRPDLKDPETVIGEIEKFDDAKTEKAAFNWVCRKSIILPEDAEKVRQAVEVAGKAKVDPMQYNSPMELMDAHANFKPTEKPIDPDTVPGLLNKVDYGNGIVVYDVENSRTGQEEMRQIINTHFGKDASPWCLLQGDGDGNLSENASRYWNHYDSVQKRVAFKDGKLIAFCASDNGKNTWWDRQDSPHNGIAIDMKMPNDELGRSATFVFDEKTGKFGDPTNIHRGSRQNGLFESWYDNGQLMASLNNKDGKLDGLVKHWNVNGGLADRLNFKDGKPDGLSEYWWNNGQLRLRQTYKDGNKDGLLEEWYENGLRKSRINYKDDKLDGLCEEWYENGRRKNRIDFKNGDYDGIVEFWYENGQITSHSTYKYGEREGMREYWHENGQIWLRENYKDNKLDGLREEWDENGQLVKREYYENGEKVDAPLNSAGENAPSDRFGEENPDIRFSVRREDVTVDPSKTTLKTAWDALKALAGKDLVNRATGITAQVNAVQRNKIVSAKAIEKSKANGFTAKEHNAAASIIDRLWENAEMVESRGDVKNGGDKNIRSIKRFVSPVYLGDREGGAYITVKESVRDGHRIYSIELEELKALGDNLKGHVPSSSSAAEMIPQRSAEDKGGGSAEGADGDVRYSARRVTPEEDRAYLDAVKRGDMERAQEMVDERLRSLGATFHRGKDPRKTQWIVQWADNPDSITSYGENQYAHLKSHLVEMPKWVYDFAKEYYGGEYTEEQIRDGVNPRRIVDAALAWDDPNFVSALYERHSDKIERLAADGVAGFKTEDGAVSFPQGENVNMFKIADAVTYDDAGRPIPLSERFDAANPDVRYSVRKIGDENVAVLDRPLGFDWNDRNSVRDHLSSMVGMGWVSLGDGERVEIGRELPKEFTRSENAEKMFRNKRLRKVRAKSANHIDELIVVSGPRTAEEARDKERENGVYYRRKVSFAVVGHEAGRAYTGDLVTYTRNGDEMLYDLTNVKENAPLTDSLKRDRQGGISRLSPNREAERRIPQSGVESKGADGDIRFSRTRHPIDENLPERKRYMDRERSAKEKAMFEYMVNMTDRKYAVKDAVRDAYIADGKTKEQAEKLATSSADSPYHAQRVQSGHATSFHHIANARRFSRHGCLSANVENMAVWVAGNRLGGTGVSPRRDGWVMRFTPVK